jgi:pimeloyl-ACP methyl ester carboxylesterase
VAYDHDLFDRQLTGLLSALNISQIDLVGTSMGGAVALVFTDRHPDMIRRLGLIAPSGLYDKYEKVTKLMRVPLLGELLIALQCQPKKYLKEPQVYAHLQYRGTRRAFLSTIRHGPFGDISDVYERVGKQERPSLLIWGQDDDAIPFEISESVKQLMPHTQFHAIDEAGHKLYYEQPEKVNPLLVEFIA